MNKTLSTITAIALSILPVRAIAQPAESRAFVAQEMAWRNAIVTTQLICGQWLMNQQADGQVYVDAINSVFKDMTMWNDAEKESFEKAVMVYLVSDIGCKNFADTRMTYEYKGKTMVISQIVEQIAKEVDATR